MAGFRWGCHNASRCLCDSCWEGRFNIVCCCTEHPEDLCPTRECDKYRPRPREDGDKEAEKE